ncbi:GGDEF domain-containing protein [Rhizobium sp. KVB221]|uniref:GGDEF domain-containing protein n=1 Tax=Rhizobium setariae TaxID=2801340 RepID=A0A937CMF1_9HYPH|nr:GGDEF domain-containing protein [Rhizobium setariae]MBL0370854.1 GGDEF domain-containing protein [Rhizobium setariae]
MTAPLSEKISFPIRYAGEKLLSMAKLALQPAFQPLVEINTGVVFGYESLIRGHDQMGFDGPLELIDRMAEIGQLAALDQMMAVRALSKFSSLADYRSATLFINLDVRLIPEGQALLDLLLRYLRMHAIPPSSICFELSERFDNTAIPEFASLVARMHKSGFKIAIDDFGVGRGEFKLLCDYPVDYLKIDRHFISGLDRSPRKQHLVRNIVGIAHALGIRVIAEGVETEAEFLACREYGVDMVQGWYIARPSVNASELTGYYPHLAESAKHRMSGPSFDELLIRRQIENPPVAYENDPIERVFEMFRQHPESSYFPVLNANNEPRGIIPENQLKEYIYHPFGRDLLKNRDYLRSVSYFVKPAPIVSLDSDTSGLVSAFANMEGCQCVLLTENMRFAGVISATSLIRILNEKQLKTAQDQNPLTGLPGNLAIVNHMRSVAMNAEQARYLCYCDFDNFKPFNDRYGFHSGDKAICLFAALMKKHIFSGQDFIGHVGGDDFFLGLEGYGQSRTEAMLGALLAEFNAEVRQLYTSEDRQAGYMLSQDRDGMERQMPLMRCSIGVLELPEGILVNDLNRISAEIANVKSSAKKSELGLSFSRLNDFGIARATAPGADAA